jgi:hypothetical protein
METSLLEKFEHIKGVVLSHESEDVFAMMKRKTYKRTNNGLQIRQHTDPAT